MNTNRHLSSRVLAMILSVLMIVQNIPSMAYASEAGDLSEYQAVESNEIWHTQDDAVTPDENADNAEALPNEGDNEDADVLEAEDADDTGDGEEADADEEVSVYTVTFVDANGATIVSKQVNDGEEISIMPEKPFAAGKSFLAWVDENGVVVTGETVVTRDMTVRPQYQEINIYKVEIRYIYYTEANQAGQKEQFDKAIVYVDGAKASANPVSVASPSTVQVDTAVAAAHGVSDITFYPSQRSVTIDGQLLTTADDDKTVLVEVEYVPFTAEYDFVYLLAGLDGAQEVEIERTHEIGVIDSTVTPTIKEYDYATFVSADTNVNITQSSGQELKVHYARKNMTLTYNTMGGTYVAPQSALYGEEVTLVSGTDVPTRQGYTFDGWYLDEDCTQEEGESVTLMANTTVYAKWKGDEVNYTIVYYFEKYNPNGENTYEYGNSGTGTAEVGTTVKADSAPLKSQNGYEIDTEKNATSSVVVAADGSSVLQVYYKLIRYTLEFTHRYNYNSHNYNDATLTHGGITYTTTKYRLENVVIGQDISSLWPTSVNSGRNNYEFTGWRYTNHDGNITTRVTKVLELTWELVEKANSSRVASFSARYDNNPTEKAVEYWLQQPDGTYVKNETYSQTYYSSSSNFSAKDIAGYTYLGNDVVPDGYKGDEDVSNTTYVWKDRWGDQYDEANIYTYSNNGYVPYTGNYNSNTTYYGLWSDGHYYTVTRQANTTTIHMDRFYYSRAQYNIIYHNGDKTPDAVEGIYYEANISSYGSQPEVPTGKEGYEWGGWYTKSDFSGEIYSWTTMPDHDVEVWAKWIAPHYTVTFNYNYEGAEEPFATQSVEKGRTSTDPGLPARDYYSFEGWYTTADCTTRYAIGSVVNSDQEVFANWTLKPLKYVVHYYLEGTTTPLFSDKTVESPILQYNEEITEKAVSVAGYLPNKNTQTINLSYDADVNIIIFYYSQKAVTNYYSVRYLLKDEDGNPTDTPAHAPLNNVEVDGSTSTVTVMAEVPDEAYSDYYPEFDTLSLDLSQDVSQNVITFYYLPFATKKVHVRYVDMDGVVIDGAPVIDTALKLGNQLSLSTALTGYTFDHVEDTDGYSGSKTVYDISSGGEITISIYLKKNLSIIASHKEKNYDGTALTSLYAETSDWRSEGLDARDTITNISFLGSQTNPGSSDTVPSNAAITRNDGQDAFYYYTISYVSDTLTVNKASVNVIVDADRWFQKPYNGETVNIGFTNPDKQDPSQEAFDYIRINNDSFQNAYFDAIWNALKEKTLLSGKNVAHLVYPKSSIQTMVEDALRTANPDYASFYDIMYDIRDCELEIIPLPITINTDGDKKTYDGVALTKDGEVIFNTVTTPVAAGEKVSVSLVNGETIGITITGSQTDAGESPNGYQIDWGTTKEKNYTISGTTGTLIVEKSTMSLAVESYDKEYDGDAHGVTVSPSVDEGTDIFYSLVDPESDDFTEDDWRTVAPTLTDVLYDENDAVAEVTVYVKAENKNYDTVIERGTIKISPKTITVTDSTSERYDGTEKTLALSKELATGVVPGEALTLTGAAIKGTAVGVYDTVTAFTWNVLKADGETSSKRNYTITVTGTLTINGVLHYDANGGTGSMSDVEIPYKGTVNASANAFTRAGYTFKNWNTSADGTGTAYEAGSAVGLSDGKNEITLYAQWTANTDTKYTVKHWLQNIDDDNYSQDQSLAADQTLTGTTDTLTNAQAYSLNGFTAQTFEQVNIAPDGTTVVNIYYDRNTYSVTYEYTGDVIPSDATKLPEEATYRYGKTITVANAATATGYTFSGWNTNDAMIEGGEFVMPAKDVVITGFWTVNNYNYTVHHYLNGTIISVKDDDTGSAAYGETITAEPATTYGSKNLIVDHYNPSQKITITAVDSNNVITIYYTLPLIITAKTDRKVYDGTPLNGSFIIGGALNISDETAIINSAGTAPSITHVNDGPITYKAETDGVPSYYKVVLNTEGTLTVTPRPIKIEGTVIADPIEYDGAEHSVSAITVEEYDEEGKRGLLEGDSVSPATVTKTGTEVGDYTQDIQNTTFTITSGEGEDAVDVTANYKIEPTDGSFSIIKNTKTLKITSEDQSWVYDGQEHNYPVYTVVYGDKTIVGTEGQKTFTLDGADTITITETAAKVKDVTEEGTKENNTFEYVLSNPAGYQAPSTETGTLTVTPRPVILTSATDSKVYDNTPLTNDKITVSGDGFVSGEGGTYDVTGSQTLVGSSENTFTYTLNENTKADNYTITQEYGTLTVTDGTNPGEEPVDPALVVTKADEAAGTTYHLGDTATFKITAKNIYDQEETITLEEIDGVTLSQSTFDKVPAGETIETTATYVITVKDVIAESFTNTVTATVGNIVKVAEATVTTEPIAIEITAKSDSKVYDGSALINSGYDLTDGTLADGDEIDSVKVEGSQKLVGSSANTASEAKIVNAKGEDVTAGYTITYVPGTLTVTDGTQPGDKEEVNPDLVVTKADADTTGGVEYALGDKVTFHITATNIYEEASTITLTEMDGVTLEQSVFENVTGGATVETNATYIIQEADVLKGTFENTVRAELGNILKIATATVSTGAANPVLSVVKEVNDSEDVDAYQLGDTVEYTITVRNTGNLTIREITVDDKLTGTVTPADAFTLEPGEEQELTASYTVTANDVVAKSILNEATASGTASNGEKVAETGRVSVTTEKIAIEITAGSSKKVYDGEPLTEDSYDLTTGELADGDKIDSVTVTGSQTLVGESANVASNAKIVNAAGDDVTAGYEISYVDGTLTVTDGTNPDDPKPVDDDKVVTKTDGENNDGRKYTLGETVTWSVWVKNIYDETKTLTITEAEGMTIETEVPETLAAGEEITITVTHVVTAADVAAGSIKNEVTATLGDLEKKGEDTVDTQPIEIVITAGSSKKVYDGEPLTEDSYELTTGKLVDRDEIASVTVTGSQTLVGESANVASNAVFKNAAGDDVTAGYKISYVDGKLTVTDGEEPDDPQKVEDGLVVTKDAEDRTYKLGDTVTFTITATNIYDEAKDILLVEIPNVTLKEDSFKAVAPGATVSTEATYTIREADLINGSFTNRVSAIIVVSDTKRLTKMVEKEVKTEDPNAHLTITKTATSTPANGTAYALGETITWNVTAANDGNLTLTNVVVTDALTGDQWTVETLAPNASQSFTATHVVTEADVLAGSVVNTATATADSPDPENPHPPVTPGTDPEDVDQNVTLTINYLYRESGLVAAPQVTQTLKAGDSYAIDSPVVDGILGSPSVVTGTMPGHDVTITVYYDQDDIYGNRSTLTIHYVVEDRKAFDDYVATYRNGETYRVTSNPMTGFTPDIPVVTGVINGPTELTVNYVRNSYRLTIRYRYADGSTAAATVTRSVPYGGSYSVASPAIAGYTATRGTVSGSMTSRDVVVTVIYLGQEQRPITTPTDDTVTLTDYDTPLGVGGTSLNAGDCFE